MHESHALISNDATLFGILAAMLGVIFYTSQSEKPAFKKFYSVIPALLLCYFLPSLLTTFQIIDPSESRLYFMASRYLLPAALILLTLSIDFNEVVPIGETTFTNPSSIVTSIPRPPNSPRVWVRMSSAALGAR